MVEELLDKLDKVRSTGRDKWTACCPVHGDKRPSMSIAEKDGRVLCHCFSCGANGLDVVEALGLPKSVLFEKELPRGHIPKKFKEEVERDRFVVIMAEEDKKRGKQLSYKDFKRLREAKSRIEVYEERLLEQNNINKSMTPLQG
jgi:hypothetical protein